MQLCLYISWHFCNKNNKLTWDESSPEKHTPPQWEVTRESQENATSHWAGRGQSQVKQEGRTVRGTSVHLTGKTGQRDYSGLTCKLHHLLPKKKSLYNPSMVWIELRGQKVSLLRGRTSCDHLDFLSYAGHQQNGRHRVFLVELEMDKGKEQEDSSLVE